MINIFLTGDHHIVRQGLRLILSVTEDITVTGEAASANDTLKQLASGLTVDVLLADVLMPDINGLKLAEQIRRDYPDVRVVLLTEFEGNDYLHYAFKAGITGYLLKTTDQDELLFAVRQAANGKKYICADMTSRLMDHIANNPPSPERVLITTMNFGSREFEVLGLIADGLSNQQIADKLFTSKRTVEGHRQSMFNKTGTKNAAQLVRFAIRAGILN